MFSRAFLVFSVLLISVTSHAQTMMTGSTSDLGLMVNGTVQASATSTGNLVVRTDPTAANHVATKNYVDNAITPETDPQVNAVTSGQWCRGTGSQVTCDRAAPVTSETDPQVGTLTNGRWCTTNGSTVNCTSTAPSGGYNSRTMVTYTDTNADGEINCTTCPSGYFVTGGGCKITNSVNHDDGYVYITGYPEGTNQYCCRIPERDGTSPDVQVRALCMK